MNLFRNACLVLPLILFSNTAFAQQLVSVSCDVNSSVTITYDNGRGPLSDTGRDYDGDGKVEFCVPDGVSVVTVEKVSDGSYLKYKVKLSN